MRPWISIVGVYHWDNTIFDNMTLPQRSELRDDLDLLVPDQELDKNLLIAKILLDLGELGLVYSDPEFLKTMIKLWADVNHDNFLALWETLLYKYNPIWNKDGTITEQRAITRSGQTSGTLADMTSGSKTGSASENRTTITDSDTTGRSVTDSDTSTRTVTDEDTTGSKTTTDTRAVAHNVTGFDTSTYSPNTQDVNSGTVSESSSGSLDSTVSGTGSEDTTVNTTGTLDSTVTDALQHADTETTSGTLSRTTGSTSSGSDTESYNRTEQGNIGVTTTQQMIREQREIVQFNLYEYMTQSFKHYFCIMTY